MISSDDIRALDCYLDPLSAKTKTALIKRAVNLVEEKTTKCGKSARKFLGCITGSAWSKKEIKFIRAHANLRQGKLVGLFRKKFGDTRTAQAIRMRKAKESKNLAAL